MKRINWPYLHIYIDFGFFQMQTAVMHRNWEKYTTTIIELKIRLFKWRWEFELYEPGPRP